jgi:hypothetical protein
MLSVLFGPDWAEELPAAFVATRTNWPIVPAATVKFKVAEVPLESIVAELTAIIDAGTNPNVDPVKFAPVTWKPVTLTELVPPMTYLGLTDEIVGC